MKKYTTAHHMDELDNPVELAQTADRHTQYSADAIPVADPWAGLFFVRSGGGSELR